MNKLLCLVVLFSFACSYKKGNQIERGHEKLYSEPNAPVSSEAETRPHHKKVVIASTNDIHGNYKPEIKTFSDKHTEGKQSIRIGGVDVVNSYFKILREVHPNLVLVNSGDILSSTTELKLVRDYYSFLKYDAITLGLGDFNLKVPAEVGTSADLFKKFSKRNSTPLVISNLYDLKTARGVEWEGTKSHIIKDVGGVRVGIIGLIPDDISQLTPVQNRVGLFIESMTQSTLRHARLLRSLGAEIIVVLTHQGLDCSTELASTKKLPPSKVNFEPLQEGVCETDNLLGQYLDRLPPQLVDVVVGGRVPNKMANCVKGTLVLSGFHDGESFNYVEFTVDTKANRIIPGKTIVHQPVMFCHEFFKETNDCYSEDSSVNHKERIPATFLGKPIERDLSLEKKFPGINKDKSAKVSPSFNVEYALDILGADLSYIHETSGESQLYVMKLKGEVLIKLLEEEYNLDRQQAWSPSPFAIQSNKLTLKIAGKEILKNQNYNLITDLESLQKHYSLVRLFKNASSQSLANYSWSTLSTMDQISSALAGPSR